MKIDDLIYALKWYRDEEGNMDVFFYKEAGKNVFLSDMFAFGTSNYQKQLHITFSKEPNMELLEKIARRK